MHTFVCVLRREQQVERLALELDAVVDAALGGARDRFFGQADGDWRSLGELFAEAHGLVDDQLLGHHTRGEAALQRLFGAEHAASQDHVRREVLADGAREALGTARAGNQPDIDLGLTEAGVLGGDDDVA